MSAEHDLINLSEYFRKVSGLTTGVFKYIGPQAIDAIEPLFEKMVIETPQWTGTTAASWNISLGGDDSIRNMDPGKVRTKTNALHKSHATAVSVALTHNTPNFKKMRAQITTKAGRGQMAIVVQNGSEGLDTAEHGPLRPINEPGNMYADFVASLDTAFENLTLNLPSNYFTKFKPRK